MYRFISLFFITNFILYKLMIKRIERRVNNIYSEDEFDQDSSDSDVEEFIKMEKRLKAKYDYDDE